MWEGEGPHCNTLPPRFAEHSFDYFHSVFEASASPRQDVNFPFTRDRWGCYGYCRLVSVGDLILMLEIEGHGWFFA